MTLLVSGPDSNARRRGAAVGRSVWRRWILAVAGCVALRAAAADEFAAARKEAAVELPAFIVEDSQHHIAWRYASVPGIEVLSTCSARETERFLAAYAAVVTRFHAIVPEELLRRSVVPIDIVLLDAATNAYAQEVTSAMVREEQRRFARRAADALADSAAPSLRGPGGVVLGGARSGSAPRMRFFPNLRFGEADSAVYFVVYRAFDFDPRELTLASDDVRYLLTGRVPALPWWYVNGMMTLFRTVQLHEDETRLLPFVWGSEATQKSLLKGIGVAAAFPPLLQVFAGAPPRDPLERVRGDRVSALFIRWCLQRRATAEALTRFVARAATERPTPELFHACFGIDVSDVDVASYFINRASSRPQFVDPPEPMPDFAAHARDASVQEIARIRGDWERRATNYVRQTRPELAAKYAEQTQRTLQRGLQQGDPDPQLLAIAGLSHCDTGDDAGARPLLELAVRARVRRPRAYFELARIRYADALAHPAGPDGTLSVLQTEDILSLLRENRTMAPPLLETYLLASDVWLHSGRPPVEADLAFLTEGMRLFPANRTLRQSASVFAKSLAGQKP